MKILFGADETDHQSTMGPLLTAAALAVILGSTLLMFKLMAELLQPLFVAVFFFYFTTPLYHRLRDLGLPRVAAYMVPVLIAVAVFVGVGWLFTAQIAALAHHVPEYSAKLSAYFERLPFASPDLAALASRTAWGTFNVLSATLLVFFYMIFLFEEAETLPGRLRKAWSDDSAEQALAIGRRINRSMIRYFFVKGAVSLVLALISGLTMAAFGLELWLLLTALIFLGNFIPYLGSAAAVVLAMGAAFLQFDASAGFFAMTGLLWMWQTLIGYWVDPMFMAHELNLSPMTVMVSLALWGWLWGTVGLVLGVPMMVSFKLVLQEIPRTKDWAVLMSESP